MFDWVRQAWADGRARATEQVVTRELHRAATGDARRLDQLTGYILAHVDEHDPDSPEGIWWRVQACSALDLRYKRGGDPRDLARWDEVTADLLRSSDTAAPLRPVALMHRVTAVMARYQRSGDPADLDAAIGFGREYVRVDGGGAEPADPDAALAMRVMAGPLLGTPLCFRYEITGDAADLAEAITHQERSLALLPHDHGDRPVLLSQLGQALRMRYERFEDPADLERAVTLGQEAADRAGEGHPEAAPVLSALAMALTTRGRRDGAPGDHDAAVRAARRALTVATPAHPQYGLFVSHANAALTAAALDGGRTDTLDEAIGLCRAVLDALPADSPFRDTFLTNLGTTLSVRYERTGSDADADAAVATWREVTGLAGARAQIRLDAAQKWGMLAAQRGRWELALEGYERAVAELPAVAWHGLGRSDQETVLARRAWIGLACDAAACAVVAGRPEHAVRLLERGRAVLWSRQVTDQAEFARLTEHRPDLATELTTLLAQLEGGGAGAVEPDPAAARARLSRRLAEVLAQVHALDGFDTFLAPSPLERVRAALPDDGYVVLVNFSRWRRDALVVSAAGVRVVPLPKLDFDETLEVVFAHLGTVLGTGARDILSDSDRARPSDTGLDALLPWLWDALAEPVLDALGLGPRERPADPTGAPRIWWCPTSVLTLAPLHAAGRHDPAGRARGSSVVDRVVSSYTPTLGALVSSGPRPAATSPERDRLLLVAMPDTPGHDQPLTIAEKDALTALLPGRVTLLEGPGATVEAVRRALADHDYVHFGCHGRQDLERPSTGGVLLHDGTLTVADVVGRRGRGELAVLAACRTATIGLTNPDEAISLATALRYGGFRHVVGTLWSVDDRAAATVAATVFGHLVPLPCAPGRTVADAVHATVHALRAASPHGDHRWVPFVHVGE